MGNIRTNADGLVEHYGTRDATGAHKLGYERDKEYVEIFDDFLYSGAFAAGSPWKTQSDTSAVDPAVVAGGEGGTISCSTGSVDNEGTQLVGVAGWIANNGGLVMETKLQLDIITGVSVFVGFTDISTIEEPTLIDASNAITSEASTSVIGFAFDTDAGTDEWWAVGTADGFATDATGQAATGTAPVAATYQTLRLEVDSDGAGARFFINNAKVGELTAGACGAAHTLYPTIVAHNRASSAVAVAVDYVYVGSNR